MAKLWDILMFLLGSIGAYLMVGMIPRLFTGKISTRRKMYIVLSIDAIIYVISNIATRTPLTILSALISIFILYFYFSKQLKKHMTEEYIDSISNIRKF